jgi:hypothetical protein
VTNRLRAFFAVLGHQFSISDRTASKPINGLSHHPRPHPILPFNSRRDSEDARDASPQPVTRPNNLHFATRRFANLHKTNTPRTRFRNLSTLQQLLQITAGSNRPPDASSPTLVRDRKTSVSTRLSRAGTTRFCHANENVASCPSNVPFCSVSLKSSEVHHDLKQMGCGLRNIESRHLCQVRLSASLHNKGATASDHSMARRLGVVSRSTTSKRMSAGRRACKISSSLFR